MIVTLEGVIAELGSNELVLEVGGVGYEVHVPTGVMEALPPLNSPVKLYTVVIYKEDGQSMYGFISKQERALFRLLVEKVSGIGPKLAMAIIGHLTPDALQQAIMNNDSDVLSQCPGIGKKTAQRLIIELKDKVQGLWTPGPTLYLSHTGGRPSQDAVAALVTLGFKALDAEKAIRRAADELGDDAPTESLIRRALGNR